MWSKLRATFHVEIAQRLDQAFLARKNFLWSFSAHIRPNNATFAARFEQTKTPACKTLAYETNACKAQARSAQAHERKTHRTQTGKAPAYRTQARKAQASKTLAYETKHARQSEDDNRNHPLASPARFPPFRQEYRAENKPRNSQRRKNAERHAEAVRIDAQIAARSERHDPDEHRRKQRA